MTTIRLRLIYKIFTAVALALALLSTALADQEAAIEVKLAGQPGEPAAIPAVEPVVMERACIAAQLKTTQPVSTEPPLSLGEALELALASHPGLASLEKEYWALDSLAWQEGRKPNPELELEFEEFGGTSDARGFRALATSLTYTQPVERGNKRTRRQAAASLEREVVLWDMAQLEHEIQAGVRKAYAAAQAAQYELEQLTKYRVLVQRIYDTVGTSVEAGRSARLELERFDIELARLDLELEIAKRSRQQALLVLAGTWGATEVDFTAVELVDARTDNVPLLADLQQQLEGHPDLGRYDAEYDALCALADVESANAVPDMAWFAGLTRLNETEETVFKVGIAWDLPLNDKNEGNISAAAYRLERVADERASSRLELETELAGLHLLAVSALQNYDAYGSSLLPAAGEALALTEEGYRYGKFDLLDVLDAQRTMLELESEQTAAWLEFHLLLAQIEALLNLDLDKLENPDAQRQSGNDTPSNVNEQSAHEEHDHE